MRWLLFVILTALCAPTATVLSARTAHAAPDDDRRAAERLSDEGITLAKQKKFQQAVEKFEAALKLYPHPVIMHNLGRAYEELKDKRRAYEYFSRALQQDYPFATDGRTRLNRLTTELAATHARLLVRITPSQSKTVVTMADGQIETHVTAPFSIWVKAGETQLSITNPEFKGIQETRAFKAGEEKELTYVLTPLPKLGFLRVSVNVPGATVSLSGRSLGRTPLQTQTVEAGAYQLEISAEGYAPWLEPVTVVKDTVTELSVTLTPRDGVPKSIPPETRGTPSWVGWTLIGSGVALAGGGAGVFMLAKDEADALGRKYAVVEGQGNPQEEAYLDEFDRKVVPLNALSTGLFIGGGALVVTGAVLLLVDPEEPVEAGLGNAFTPSFGVGAGQVHVGGTWRF